MLTADGTNDELIKLLEAVPKDYKLVMKLVIT